MKRNVSGPVFTLVLAALGVFALTASAQAVERPYIARGTAQFINANGDFVGTGTATYLGSYTEVGNAQLTPIGGSLLQVNATNTYTAANGDQLRGVITGQLDGSTGAITATITYVGGTGRFAGASGTSILKGQLLPGGVFEVQVKGTIDY